MRELIGVMVFGLAIALPFLWVSSGDSRHWEKCSFTTAENIQGYRYIPLHLGRSVKVILATTNILNGFFVNSQSNRFSVLHVNWARASGLGGNVLAHSPDICWLGDGYKYAKVDCPEIVSINLCEKVVRCNCRVMVGQFDAGPEIVVWFATVDGFLYPVESSRKVTGNTGARIAENWFMDVVYGFKERCGQFVQLLRKPIPLDSEKQYVRVSKCFSGRWDSDLIEIETFLQNWLVCNSQSK